MAAIRAAAAVKNVLAVEYHSSYIPWWNDLALGIDNPLDYVGTPEDVVPAVLLLCSNEGRYITGSEIIVDGGMHL